MRKLLTVLLLLPFFASATNYYVSNAGSDVANGLTTGTSWATITKINGATFASGDSILFKRGDTWAGITIVPPRGDIHYGAYSTGANPIVTGLITISSWTNLGGNIYSATVTGSPATVDMVLIGAQQIPMGRTPNYGYNTYTAFTNTTSITDGTLTGTPSWVGAEVVIRKNSFTLTRATVSNQAASVLTFPATGGNGFTANFGYFFQNSLQTLDTTNEWYYDGAGTIKMYNTITPPTIQVATLASLVSSQNSGGAGIKSNLSFENIDFKGCEQKAINILFCNNLKIKKCNVSYVAETGLYHKYSIGTLVDSCTFTEVNTVGIKSYGGSIGSNTTISNTSFKRIGWYAGMSTKVNYTDYAEGDLQTAIVATDSALLASGNTIDSTGYNGISVMSTKNNQIVQNNEVKHFCYNKNDGGGIYNGGVRGNGAGCSIYFINNIVHDAFDASDGTGTTGNPHVRGIYLDATSDSVKVLNNTVFNCYGGIYLANARGNIVRGNNILYGGSNINPYFEGMMEAAYGKGYQTTINNIFTQNIIVSTASKNVMYLNTDYAGNNVDMVGTIDSNYYINASSVITSPWAYNYGPGVTQYTFTAWKAAHPYDLHSTYLTPKLSMLRYEYNATGSALLVSLEGYNYTDITGTNYPGAVTLQPHTSVVLFKGRLIGASNKASKINFKP